jgi:glycine hydroxymethyltransferase
MLNFFTNDLNTVDPAVARLINYEAERQERKLILIPSESQAPEAVREALGSVFQNVYAEGYPDPGMIGLSESEILDYEMQLARYRRASDQRYYKGVEYVDIIESLARRRAAEAFAVPGVPPEAIFANVQPLSGAPANNAVYAALVPPGSTVMGMDLLHGGHLTHGSPANRSGKLYNIVSYGVDPKTERLDYDAIEELARQARPKMIIAGFTSYSWAPDWPRFRQIADAVGAYLLADIAHLAGMIAAGVLPSPVGYADVISFTTHKTLYGPRGACILTTDRALAGKIDSAVFPGEQGGPHVNAMAGMAVAFKLAHSPEFASLQQQVVANAAHLAEELQKRGLRIPYGGTNTHMLLVDCKSVRTESGPSPDGVKGTPLMGDPAARMLDLAGIVLNRNTIPGDKSARNPSGIRMGTPWITQRGFRAEHIERLAEIIARVLHGSQPVAYAGRRGPSYFAKIDFDLLEQAKWDVVQLACDVDLPCDYQPSGYPHHFFLHKPSTGSDGEWDVIEIEGEHARGFCNVTMTNDVYALGPGELQPTWVLEPDGRLMAAGVLRRPTEESTCFQLFLAKTAEPRVAHWLRALSDGFVDLDPTDPFVKAPGPVVVRRLPHELADEWTARPPAQADFEVGQVGWAFHKPYWVGMHGDQGRATRGNGRLTQGGPTQGGPTQGDLPVLASFTWQAPVDAPLKRTLLYDIHRGAGAKIVPFAGYEMPVQYTGVSEEHQTVRHSAGLFDVSHMGLFEFSGENVHLFLNTVTTNDVTTVAVGSSQYTYLLAPDGHVIDDAWLYRIDNERFWMVVNAANTDKDWAWVNAVRESRGMIDPQRPWARALGTECVTIRNLHDPDLGDERWMQLALQGPTSLNVLLAMVAPAEAGNGGQAVREQLAGLARAQIIPLRLAGYDLWLSRTGYTGEPIGFEIFVHPQDITAFWRAVVAAGAAFGARPIGLAARDSLRIEAGLPLYGHELAGPLDLNPADAGFAPYVKLNKPFFIGKSCYMAHEKKRTGRVVRFRVDEEHAPVPNLGDLVVNHKGRVIGTVTSCSIDTEGRLSGLGYVEEPNTARDTHLGVYRLSSKNWESRPLTELRPGDRVQMPDDITVIERFLNKK